MGIKGFLISPGSVMLRPVRGDRGVHDLAGVFEPRLRAARSVTRSDRAAPVWAALVWAALVWAAPAGASEPWFFGSGWFFGSSLLPGNHRLPKNHRMPKNGARS